ncbi:MAG: hypothetical protein AAGH46_12075 [Bacteroidota bacterium]
MTENQKPSPILQPPSPPIRIFKTRLCAILEVTLFYSLFIAYDYIYGDGHRMVGTELHPFWIPILIVSAHYGTLEGMIAAAIGTIFLYANNVPEQNVSESLFQYQIHLTLVPLLWFFFAFVLGEIRSKIIYDKYKLELVAYKQQVYADEIAQSYEELRVRHETLLSHVTTEKATLSKVVEVLKDMERASPGSILANSWPVIQFAVNPEKYSIYAVGTGGLEVVFAEGWGDEEPYSRRFSKDTEIYKYMTNEKKTLCIINSNERSILKDQGVLAAPLLNPNNDEVFGMIKIEMVDILDLNISMINTFKMVCALIGVTYMNALENRRTQSLVFKDTSSNLLTYNFYLYMTHYLSELCKDYNFSLYEISISMPNLRTQPIVKETEELLQLLESTLKKPGFQLFLGKSKKLELKVLIPFKDQMYIDSEIVRIEHTIDKHEIGVGLEYSIKSRCICSLDGKVIKLKTESKTS